MLVLGIKSSNAGQFVLFVYVLKIWTVGSSAGQFALFVYVFRNLLSLISLTPFYFLSFSGGTMELGIMFWFSLFITFTDEEFESAMDLRESYNESGCSRKGNFLFIHIFLYFFDFFF